MNTKEQPNAIPNQENEEQEKKEHDPVRKFVQEKMGLDPEEFSFSYKTVAEIEPDPKREGHFLGTFIEFSNYHDLLDYRKKLPEAEKEKMDQLHWPGNWYKIATFADNDFWDRLKNSEDELYKYKDEFFELCKKIRNEELEDEYAKAAGHGDENDLPQVEEELNAPETAGGVGEELSEGKEEQEKDIQDAAEKVDEYLKTTKEEAGDNELKKIPLEMPFNKKESKKDRNIIFDKIKEKGKEIIKKQRLIAGAIITAIILGGAGAGTFVLREERRRKKIDARLTETMGKLEKDYEEKYREVQKIIGGISGLKDIIRGIDGNPDGLSYEDKGKFLENPDGYYNEFLDEQKEKYNEIDEVYKQSWAEGFEAGKKIAGQEKVETEEDKKEEENKTKTEIEQQFTDAFNIASGGLSEQEIDQLLIIIDRHDTTEDMSVSDIQNAMEKDQDGKIAIKPDLIKEAKEKAAEQQSKK